MPDYPIIDSHLHLWDPARFRMRWVEGNPTLEQPYDPGEYREHTAGLDIEAMVYLQVDVDPAYALLEAQWVVERAAEDPRIRAMVPYAPLEDGDQVRSFLDAMVATSPLIKGIRRLLQGEADPEFCLQPRFVRGVQLLADYDLSFDLCIRHEQFPSIIKLVEQCPQVSFVLDHIGKADIKGGVLDPWRDHIAAIAAFPNVMCKISGMVTEADTAGWTADDLAPYVAHVIAQFGEDRVMFGDHSPEAKRKLGAEKARRFYRL
jgi:L-fuconolactonase